MSDLFKFSDYDVFAYLASGLAAFAVSDVVFDTNLVIGADWSASTGALTIAGAYLAGQVLASPAAWLMQRWLVHRVLLGPTTVLMGSRPLRWRRVLRATLLGVYYSPLDAHLKTRVREASRRNCGADLADESLFWCAFPVAKADPIAYGRMEGFLRLYGFCRNAAFVAAVGAVAFAVRAIFQQRLGDPDLARQLLERSALATVVALGMVHRYLKFYRAYALEVLSTFGAKASDRT